MRYNSFKKNTKDLVVPLSAVWLMNTISEYKGKQDLYARQSPQVLKTFTEMALIESAESSNRIEGVTVDHERLQPLIIGHSKPRDRSEEEVCGYRKALDLIHKKHTSLKINPEVIKELHCLCRGESWDSGKWKEKDNDIIKKYPNGRVEVIFKPVSAAKTHDAVKQLCLTYEYAINQTKYPPLYALAGLILDFLCIHPFRDGNGRVSRLLTLLALYQQGFTVGKYISLERIIEQSKETYYESLNKSSQNWHEAKQNIVPWLNYFLGIVLAAYKEFEQRADDVKPAKGVKTDLVTAVIMRQSGEFKISDIISACPNVSRVMVKKVFQRLKKGKKIECLGKGQASRWRRIG